MAELMAEPDIDCTAVAYDGSKLWATQRARMSLNLKTINMNQR